MNPVTPARPSDTQGETTGQREPIAPQPEKDIVQLRSPATGPLSLPRNARR